MAIEVENFKSLVEFNLPLAKFNCLVGLNGVGKSTVLQFIDFLSQLVHGDMKGWLGERQWKSNELKSKLTKKVNIDFCVRFSDQNFKPAGQWKATYSPTKYRCTKERIELRGSSLEISKDKVEIHDSENEKGKTHEIAFDYEGSILSKLKEELLPPSIRECKMLFQEVKSLDLLAPEHLRRRTRESSGVLGRGGQNLSAFLHEMSDRKRQELLDTLKRAYPRLNMLHARSLRSGWKQIEIGENYKGASLGFFPTLTTEARHINDGMLRLMAIFAELSSDHSFLLFDEIENGINPELVEFVLEALVKTPKQIVVTTHSPMILNYLDDETAKAGVHYLYKTPRGHTKSIPFFSIPSLAEKLKFMGPGEAFVDTNLIALADEISEITGEEE